MHKAHKRLQGAGRVDAQSPPQLFDFAAQVLRSVMVDFARQRRLSRLLAAGPEIEPDQRPGRMASLTDADRARTPVQVEWRA